MMVELVPEPGRGYPIGWTRLRLDLRPDSREPFAARLCVEYRDEQGAVIGRDGSVGPARVSKYLDRLVDLPAGACRVRLLLSERQALRVIGASFQETSKAKVLVARPAD